MGVGRHPSDVGSGERMSRWYLLRLLSLVQQSQTGPREEQEASSLGSIICKGPGLEDDGTETETMETGIEKETKRMSGWGTVLE